MQETFLILNGVHTKKKWYYIFIISRLVMIDTLKFLSLPPMIPYAWLGAKLKCRENKHFKKEVFLYPRLIYSHILCSMYLSIINNVHIQQWLFGIRNVFSMVLQKQEIPVRKWINILCIYCSSWLLCNTCLNEENNNNKKLLCYVRQSWLLVSELKQERKNQMCIWK